MMELNQSRADKTKNQSRRSEFVILRARRQEDALGLC
jgi:hypothetical protein